MTPELRRSAIIAKHGTLHSLSKLLGVKQESIVVAIETGHTASPKLASECRKLGVKVELTKTGRQWRHYRFGAGE